MMKRPENDKERNTEMVPFSACEIEQKLKQQNYKCFVTTVISESGILDHTGSAF